MPSINDYIIAFDERGKPYIAHGIFDIFRRPKVNNKISSGMKKASVERKNHKYIMRISENGKYRYFYTQNELKAYYKAKQKKSDIKNQNGTSLQNDDKDAEKDSEQTKSSESNDAKSSTASSSSKPRTGVADYARQKAADANKASSTSTPSTSDNDEASETKKSSKSSSKSSSGNSGSSSGQTSTGAARQFNPITQSPSAMIQQALNAQKTANTSLTSTDEFDDTIAKAAKNLEGADKYEEYKRAVDAFKANPTRENALKRDQLKQEWLATPHGKYVSSISSELQKKKQANDPKMLLKNLTSLSENNVSSLMSSLNLKNIRR